MKLGISTDRLFAYETGRAKVPWGVGNQVCEMLGISQDWLIGTLDDAGVYLPVDLSGLDGEKLARTPFSEVYVRYFSPRAQASRAEATIKAAEVTALVDEYIATMRQLSELGRKNPELITSDLIAEIKRTGEMIDQARRKVGRLRL